MIEYIYWNFENNPVSTKTYKEFLKRAYGERAEYHFKRAEWYNKTGNYHLLLALYNGDVVGQSSAYRSIAHINGHE